MIWGQYAAVPWRNQAHAHDLHELVTCLSDSGRHWIHGVGYEFKAGRTFFLPSGSPHLVEGMPEAPARIAFVCFDQAFLAQTADDSFQRAVLQLARERRYASDFESSYCATVLDLTRRIQEELADLRLFGEAMVSSLVRELLVLHFRAVPASARSEATAAAAKIGQVTRRIADSPAAAHCIDHLAEASGMSRSVFTRAFRKHTGMSLVEFVRDARIRLAMTLLGRTEEPVSTVAERCGFRNLGHFHAIFRAVCGMTPRRYRCTVAASGPFSHVLRVRTRITSQFGVSGRPSDSRNEA